MIRPSRRGTGFTLIEVAVVLVLMAMLASFVVMSSRGMIGSATSEEVIRQISSLDAEARRYALQQGKPVRIELDTEEGRLILFEPLSGETIPLAGYRLPQAYTVQSAWRLVRGEQIEQQTLKLDYDKHGKTSTWGLMIQGPRLGNPGAESITEDTRTLVVLGMTGQLTIWDSNEQAQDILAQSSRRNAD